MQNTPGDKRKRGSQSEGAPPKKRRRGISVKELRDVNWSNQWRQDEEDQRAAEIAVAAQIAQAAATARAQELANPQVAPAGRRGDGNLHIAFVRMGQGDCTIISTPSGRTVMIDCGSSSTESDAGHDFGATDEAAYQNIIKRILYSRKFLGGNNIRSNKLDILILTHSDGDHYDKLSTMLRLDVQIYTCYHSGQFVAYSAAATNTWIRRHMIGGIHNTALIKAVTANEHGVRSIGGINLLAQDNDNKIERLDARQAIRIVQEANCNISILASNVTLQHYADGSNDTNRGSVVTLIEAFGQKIMICGDATMNTERYVLQTYLTVNNLNVLQVPHHGSSTSSHQLFINAMQPGKCIVSTGKNVGGIGGDHLPRSDVLDRYLASPSLPDNAVNAHVIYHWVPGYMGSFAAHSDPLTIERNLYTTGSNDTQHFSLP